MLKTNSGGYYNNPYFNNRPRSVTNAYAINTHASLNQNIAKEFSRLRYKHFSNDELKAFILGGIQEDKMIYTRPLNHFYEYIN